MEVMVTLARIVRVAPNRIGGPLMPKAPVIRAGFPAIFTLRSIWLKSLFAAGLIIGAAPSEGLAQAPGSPERSADDRLALKVQAALAADPKLKPHDLNLLVNVVDGFAVIGGAVPSEDLLPRIRSVALAVENIRGAKVSGWISNADGRDDPLARKVAEQMQSEKPVPKHLLEPLPAPVPSALPPLAIPVQPAPVETTPPPLRKEPAPGNTVVRRPAPTGMMMDPVVSSGAPRAAFTPGAAPLPYPTIPPPGVPTKPLDDPRFAELTVKLSGSTAVIAGKVRKLSDAWDYADAVQKWPGIDTVVVGGVKVK